MMRRSTFFIALIAFVATPLFAQSAGGRQGAPDPAPPAMVPVDETADPQVTIRKREGATIEEYRMNGRLYKIVVTPERGLPYTLIDPRGDGGFVPQDTPGTPHLSVPMWVIGTF